MDRSQHIILELKLNTRMSTLFVKLILQTQDIRFKVYQKTLNLNFLLAIRSCGITQSLGCMSTDL
jgi:hypothetical protein